jgi:hypothetical protein
MNFEIERIFDPVVAVKTASVPPGLNEPFPDRRRRVDRDRVRDLDFRVRCFFKHPAQHSSIAARLCSEPSEAVKTFIRLSFRLSFSREIFPPKIAFKVPSAMSVPGR